MKLCISVCLSIFLVSAADAMISPATFIQLPPSLTSKAIYHVKAQEISEFCCAYNALYNACNLEELCGFPNCFSDYSLFSETCLSFLIPQRINPKDGAVPPTLNVIQQRLGLRNCCFLQLDICKNRAVEVLQFLDTVIIYEGREYHDMIRIKEINAIRAFLAPLKKKFDESMKSSEIAHFICSFQMLLPTFERHAILLSLVQNQTGRGLYIFDNTNAKIEESSPAKWFVDFLCDTFAVSSQDQFRGPCLPAHWPSIPSKSNQH